MSMSIEQRIEKAEESLRRAKVNADRAGRERIAGRITKSCHREAVKMRDQAQQRLNELKAQA
jgi:hypothetical protein